MMAQQEKVVYPRYAVIRLRGIPTTPRDIAVTLDLLRLRRKFTMVVVKGSPEEIRDKINRALSHHKGKAMTIGVLASDETMGFYREGLIISLGSRNDPKEMAKNLFSRLRTFDELGVEKIFAEDIPLNNETLALINRLYKAAGYAFI